MCCSLHAVYDHNKNENTRHHLCSCTNNISWSNEQWEYSFFPSYHLLRCSGEQLEARVLPDNSGISTTTATYWAINHTVRISEGGYDASACCCQAHFTLLKQCDTTSNSQCELCVVLIESAYCFCFFCLVFRAYINLAAELGLWVILRPGPYVSAELDLGGLPR